MQPLTSLPLIFLSICFITILIFFFSKLRKFRMALEEQNYMVCIPRDAYTARGSFRAEVLTCRPHSDSRPLACYVPPPLTTCTQVTEWHITRTPFDQHVFAEPLLDHLCEQSYVLSTTNEAETSSSEQDRVIGMGFPYLLKQAKKWRKNT